VVVVVVVVVVVAPRAVAQLVPRPGWG